MSTEPSSDISTTIQQRQQAHRLLLLLQWLIILLLIIALAVLYISQQRFENRVNERLQNNEQIVTRLNELDDRLFASNQQVLPVTNGIPNSQAQNQLDLLRIQIRAVDRLLVDNNYSAAIELLRGLQWQLSQESNEIAPALTEIIRQGLNKDIKRLQALDNQPSPWQLQNIAIQNIQEFLHSHELNNSHELDSSHERRNSDNAVLTRQQLTIHEVIMTLNLGIQASNMRKQDQLVGYLQQARKQLQTLVSTMPAASQNTKNTQKTNKSSSTSSTNTQGNSTKIDLNTMPVPSTIPEVINWLDELIANAPTPTPLFITQILDQPKPAKP